MIFLLPKLGTNLKNNETTNKLSSWRELCPFCKACGLKNAIYTKKSKWLYNIKLIPQVIIKHCTHQWFLYWQLNWNRTTQTLDSCDYLWVPLCDIILEYCQPLLKPHGLKEPLSVIKQMNLKMSVFGGIWV